MPHQVLALAKKNAHERGRRAFSVVVRAELDQQLNDVGHVMLQMTHPSLQWLGRKRTLIVVRH